MIPYTHPDEKKTLLRYADLLENRTVKDIIYKDCLDSKEEALQLANFFWDMVTRSNIEDQVSGHSSDYILEKIIITLMAYFRSSGYEDEWETVTDKR